jgi:hypothetical protein
MTTSIRKEIRLLLPLFILTVGVTTAGSLIFNGSDAAGIVAFIYAACAALLGASSFGNEYIAHTMPLLLAQPTPRSRLWADKMLVLGVALAITWFIVLVDIALFIRGEGKPGNFGELTFMMFGAALIALCSTPLATLLLKNIIGAMGAAVAWPMGLFLLMMGFDWLASRLFERPDLFFADAFDKYPYLFIVPMLAIYCAGTWKLGYKTFAGMQLVDTQSQEVSLPAGIQSRLGPFFLRLLPRYSSPIASLVRKELQLQRTSLIVAVACCFVLAAITLGFAIHADEVTTSLMYVPILLCLFLVPLISGGMAFAEERNLGLYGWQLTQPPSKSRQWLVKILVAFFVNALLGVGLPLIMFAVVKPLFVSGHASVPHLSELVEDWGPSLTYFGIFSVVLYAASISTNTMRAIIAALGMLAALSCIVGLVNYLLSIPFAHNDFLIGLADHVGKHSAEEFNFYIMTTLLAGVITFIFICWYLTFFNFRKGEITTRLRWVQLTGLGAFFAVACAVQWALVFASEHFTG